MCCIFGNTERPLRRSVHGRCIAAAIVNRVAMSFQAGMMNYRRAIFCFDTDICFRQRFINLRFITAFLFRRQIAVWIDTRCTFLERVFSAHDVWQNFVLNLNRANRIFGKLRRVGGDCRDRLTGESHDVFAFIGRWRFAFIGLILSVRDFRHTIASFGDLFVRRADDSSHAGQTPRRARINFKDARVRMRRTQHAAIEHSRQTHVRCVTRRAGNFERSVNARQAMIEQRVLIIRPPSRPTIIVNLNLDHRLNTVDDLRNSNLLFLLDRLLLHKHLHEQSGVLSRESGVKGQKQSLLF